ncbi:Pancreatic triacylglycerol lipase-like protein [Euroglyphus maynei]|uniref:Pancreatic triacylglycerol lipase-like protein n=1 Tax=Euroglyphus maynei TaxID=6958 RepID=A0A1Y3B738_EURMA|nr:Pancreatic triacylglycerol lipase-like protein [Euroglyphus maynei]
MIAFRFFVCFIALALALANKQSISTTNIVQNPVDDNITKLYNSDSLEKFTKKLIYKTMSTNPSLNISSLLHLKMPDPWDIDTIKPKIVFYKRGQPEFEVDHFADAKQTALTLNKLGFLHTDRLILITHGFHNNFNTDWLHDYKEKIFNVSAQLKLQQTVAILGWGDGADILVFRYRQAAANVLTVGEWLSQYIKTIKDVSPNTIIYGIGHSLGAHVMGVAGRLSKGFDRISGLDPAGPCFEKVVNSQTLRATDARFVDVIHTDGYDSKLDPSEWFFPVNHYGSLVPIGTLDFYPNYGYHQPGAGTFTVAGSHLRSLELFEWSITNPHKFLTEKVLSSTPDFDDPVNENEPTKYTAEMGFYADRWKLPPINACTLYYIQTNKQQPWI